jgi:gamma-glutamyl:cysteine ligase YbdK (ATP-grasp superfamily)
MSKSPYSIFSVLGIEIEYMLVDPATLTIQPKSDMILKTLAGEYCNEINLGQIAVSNELVLHVIELKNASPCPIDQPITQYFQSGLSQLQSTLDAHHLSLLPTAAHPWMNPLQETQRWPHGNRTIYQQYDAIFDCRGHGWSNLQSMHVNLPFANDEEFCALHNTIRLILPAIPALAASSPFLEGKRTDFWDTRLTFYEKNQQKIPAITGLVIPEYIQTPEEYRTSILKPMYEQIAPFDKEQILQEEWLNSRGAIPKFEYGAIEIRIIDSQECVNADIAIAKTVFFILKSWCESGYYPKPPNVDTKALKALYDQTLTHGFSTTLEIPQILEAYQLPKRTMHLRDVWSQLIERVSHMLSSEEQITLESILRHGNLSERLVRACNGDYSRPTLHRVYSSLIPCLQHNRLFL